MRDLVRVHVNGLFTHLQCGSKIVLFLNMPLMYGRLDKNTQTIFTSAAGYRQVKRKEISHCQATECYD